MNIAIVGGGIAGLALALNLHERRIPCCVYEAVPDIKEIGVGITLLPHAMRELTALRLQDSISAVGIETRQSSFFNRFGQLIYKEARGRFGGYRYPEFAIHRGRLHLVLLKAVLERLGENAIFTARRCIAVEQDGTGVTVHFRGAPSVRADAAIACDGINSAVRQQFYPDDAVCFAGINSWRGVTRRRPFLDGRTYVRIGSLRTGKIVIYPIVDSIDAAGSQLINWVAEMPSGAAAPNDWNKPGKLEDFYPVYENWRFDWLDVAALIREADVVLEYPMVDKNPLKRWAFGRITLAGDAAHPMYPRGSNGAAQALIDVRVLADFLRDLQDPIAAITAYESARLEPTTRVIQTNRESPPDIINIKVEELTGDRPFDDLDAFISQEELRALSERYSRIAGFSRENLE